MAKKIKADQFETTGTDSIRTSTGPTDLAVGAVADGEYLRRSGATVVGDTPAGTTTAEALGTTGADVDVGSAAPPTAGQVLKASTPTAATWQDAADADAIHDNVDGEINAIAAKSPVVAGDLLLIEDSEASNAKKKTTISGLRITEAQITDLDHTDANAIHKSTAAEISTVTEKASPVSADLVLIEDSEDSNNKKRVQVGNLPGGSGGAVGTIAYGDYLKVSLSTTQTDLVDDELIVFDTTVEGRGDLSLSSGRITGLRAGRTYLLLADAQATHSAIFWFRLCLYDYTSSVQLQRWTFRNPSLVDDNDGSHLGYHIFTPDVDTTVEVRRIGGTAGVDVQGNSPLSPTTLSVIEIGALQANVIGGLEFMDIIEVDSDVTSVSFGASGDGAFQRALDGDVDEIYEIHALWVPPATNLSNLQVQPNGVVTNQETAWEYHNGASTPGSNSTSDLVLGRTDSTTGVAQYSHGTLYAKTGSSRFWNAIESVQPTAAANCVGRVHTGVWYESSTNITSLDLVSVTASGIKAGSRFVLYRRTTANVRADNASIYERNVEATVAQGTNSEVEYTTGHATYQGSAIGLSVSLNDTVTAGTITVNLKIGGSTVLTVVLDSTTNPTFNRALATIGSKAVSPGNEIEVGIATSTLTTTGGGTPGITVNAMLVCDAFFQPPLPDGSESNLWIRPENPHADDDEFESTALDSSWGTTFSISTSAVDPYAAFASGDTRVALHTDRRRSWAMMQSPADGSKGWLHKPITLPTNLLVWARLSFNYRNSVSPVNNDMYVALALTASSGGVPSGADSIQLGLNESEAGVLQANGLVFEGGATVFNETTADIYQTGVLGQSFEYVAIHKVGTVYHLWVGTPGGCWVHLGSRTYAGAAMDRVAIAIQNTDTTSPGNAIVGCDFVRFVESGTFLP